MGLCSLTRSITHGAVYLTLKTTADVHKRARDVALRDAPAAIVLMTLAVGWQQIIRGTALSMTFGTPDPGVADRSRSRRRGFRCLRRGGTHSGCRRSDIPDRQIAIER